MKKKAQEAVSTIKQVYDGAETLLLASSLAIVSFYNGLDLARRSVDEFEYYARITATVVIGYLAAKALVQAFKVLGSK